MRGTAFAWMTGEQWNFFPTKPPSGESGQPNGSGNYCSGKSPPPPYNPAGTINKQIKEIGLAANLSPLHYGLRTTGGAGGS